MRQQIDFKNELDKLTRLAEDFIYRQLEILSCITIFDKIDDPDFDIDEDAPVFDHYQGNGMLEETAVMKVTLCEEKYVVIEGIHKGTSYPQRVVLSLAEMSNADVIALADYLSSEDNYFSFADERHL